MSLLSSTHSSDGGTGFARRALMAWRWWLVPILIVMVLWIAAMTYAHRADEGARRTYTVL